MKFITLRTRDIQQLLSPEQKTALMGIIKAINDGRAKTNQPEQVLFVLNARDQFAQPALDAYIQAIHNNTATAGNDACRNAADAAEDARTRGIMAGPQKLPS